MERIEAGVRRVPELDLGQPLPESDPRLLARIRHEIEANGPMPFDRFMAIALYDEDAGYYAGEREAGSNQGEATGGGPGRAGDFLTAPEAHPIFGWTIARRLEPVWRSLGRPARFVIREHGPGSGGLAVGILDGLRRAGAPLLDKVRYQAIDVSPRARHA